jgi:hypothetical protein
MALQYDTPTSTAEFSSAINNNVAISAATAAAITTLLGLDTAASVNVAGWDGVTAPVTSGAPDVLAITVDGAAGDEAKLVLPESVADAKVILIDSDADVSLTVGSEASPLARVAAASDLIINGGNGNDTLTVLGATNVTLDGGAGNDTLVTGSGDDVVTLGTGNNTADTGAGNDTIVTGQGHDVVVAGSGFDTIQVLGNSTAFDVSTVGSLLVLNGTGDSNISVTAQGAEFVSFADGNTIAVASTEEQATALRLFEGVLGRDADQGGAESFSAAADGGISSTTLAQSVLSSAEYQNDLNDEFVANAFQSFLGRPVDDSGEAAFLNLLANGGTRADVINGLVNSAEGQEVPLGNTAFVNELYESALGRGTDNDASGLANWVTALNNGLSRDDVADQIFGSVEAQQKTNLDFVNSIYENALGRAEGDDLAGKASWTNALENGFTQADVAIGIVGSPEAQDHITNVVVVHGAV